MSEGQFGRLEEVDICQAWKHEARDFTPWLLQNLDRLSEAIGVPLEAEGREVSVGPFSADILARASHDGSRVLIENQLFESDHSHLGQIMTYLAGLDARIIIWIARSFREWHLSAVKWLNEATSEEFAFFAVKVKAVRIGASPLAPVFEVVERPNGWERTLQAKAKEADALTDWGKRNLAFWTKYVETVPGERERSGDAKGTPSRWRHLRGLDMVLSMYVSNNYVGLFVRSVKGGSGEALRARLTPHADELERRLGAKLGDQDNWYFQTYRKADTSLTTEWDELIDWLSRTADKYEATLRGVLESPTR